MAVQDHAKARDDISVKKVFETESQRRPDENKQQEQIATTQEKQPFPWGRFSLAAAVFLFGILGCVVLSQFPLNPTPLDKSFSFSKPNHWLYPIERHAPLRLPVIETESAITDFAKANNNLALRFADATTITVSRDAELGEIKGNRFNSVVANIPFEPDSSTLSRAAEREIDRLFSDNKLQRKGKQRITISGYVSDKHLEQSNRPLPPTLEQKSRGQQIQQQPVQSYEFPDVKGQQQEPQGYSREYALALGERIANSVSRYLVERYGVNPANVETISYGQQRHYNVDRTIAQGWRNEEGKTSGAVISVEQTVFGVNWSRLPVGEPTRLKVDEGTWEIVGGNQIDYLDTQGEKKTVAVLPSVIEGYFTSKGTPDWSNFTPQTYPSPVSLLLLLGSAVFAIRILSGRGDRKNEQKKIIKQRLVDSFFVSDAPVSDKAQDKLDFDEISRAISRFLRNASTRAPLTLAVTGVWGCGKSSLMYLIKQRLEDYHLHPVWINAWHHQNEEQFLAGLLNVIQHHAIPPVWRPAGLLYRWNLLRMRCSERPFYYSVLTILLLSSSGYLLAAGELPKIAELYGSMTAEGTSLVNVLLQASSVFWFSITGAVGGGGLVLGGMDRISGLAKTGFLRSLFRSPGKNLDLRSSVALREKFAREFKLLCDALGDTTLTVFIDDLDRCKEKRIMDVMETVNYLASSGDCYVVLGMEREPVERAIATYYRETHDDLDGTALRHKSRRYLEKIINIEIPVPSADKDQCAMLIDDGEQKKQENPSPTKRKPLTWAWLKPLTLCLIFILPPLAGFYSFSLFNSEQKPQSLQAAESRRQESVEPAYGPIADYGSIADDVGPINLNIAESNEYIAPVVIPLVILAFIALIIRVERYRQQKRIVVNDSESFLDAVSVWASLMGELSKTPRSIKRYVNRTRYLAMRNLESDLTISDESIVTLAALRELVTVKSKEKPTVETFVEQLPVVADGESELHKKISALVEKIDKVTADQWNRIEAWIRNVSVS